MNNSFYSILKNKKERALYLVSIFLFLFIILSLLTQSDEMHLDRTLLAPSFFSVFSSTSDSIQGSSSLISPFLGTDTFGRSLYQTIFSSSLESFKIALLCSLLSILSSLIIVFLIDLAPTLIQRFSSFLLNTVQVFPSLLLVLFIQTLRGAGMGSLILALWIGAVPNLVFILNLELQNIKVKDYTQAHLALGASRLRLFTQSYLRNLWDPLQTRFLLLFCSNLIAEATLSYLGIGLSPDHLSWGSLILMSKEVLIEAPHLLIVTGIALISVMSSLIFLSKRLEQKVFIRRR